MRQHFTWTTYLDRKKAAVVHISRRLLWAERDGKRIKTVIRVHIYKNTLYQVRSRVIINKSDSYGENGSSSFKEHPYFKNKMGFGESEISTCKNVR